MKFGYFGLVLEEGFSIIFSNASKSLRLNKRYPFAGFRRNGTSPRPAHLRSVFWAIPSNSAASAVFTYSLNFGIRPFARQVNFEKDKVYQSLHAIDIDWQKTSALSLELLWCEFGMAKKTLSKNLEFWIANCSTTSAYHLLLNFVFLWRDLCISLAMDRLSCFANFCQD